MKKLIITILLLMVVISSSVFAQGDPPSYDCMEREPAPAPLISLTIFDPWRMVIGSDTPSFALYEDGVLIYVDYENWEVVSVQLDEDALTELLDTLAIGDTFLVLDEYYDTLGWTDQPTYNIRVRVPVVDEDKNVEYLENSVFVYGNFGNYTDPSARRRPDEPTVVVEVDEGMDEVPAEFLRLYEIMISYIHEDAEKWEPEVVEIMLWDYPSASSGARWSPTFPDLFSTCAIEMREDEFYSIIMPYERFDELLAFHDENSGAVELGDNLWSYAWRFPFPHENYPMPITENVDS